MTNLGLEAWHDFYLIVGGAAAGLTGLMFVVVTLAPRVIAARGSEGTRAFVSPTVVFFTTILSVSAVMTVPVLTPPAIAGLLGVVGLGGMIYMLVIGAHRLWRESDLPRRDWVGYVGLPILAYAFLCVGGGLIWLDPIVGLPIVGGSMIVFLVVGVRNAWDLVLWMANRADDAKAAANAPSENVQPAAQDPKA